MLAVTRLGIVTPQQLGHNRRYAILIIAVVAMLLPGHRPGDDADLMLPLYLLFEFSLLLARWFGTPSSEPRSTEAPAARRPGSRTAFLYAPDPMLFDLKSGKRRRVVQIVFGFLAFIFFISFVGFGIGSDVSGGIFDAIGIGGGGSSSATRSTRSRSRTPRRRSRPTRTTSRPCSTWSATTTSRRPRAGSTTDPQTGATSISEEARTELEQAAQAWTDYLKTKPKNTDLSTAANAAQVFVLLGDAEGAAEAQAIVAEGQKTAAAYGQLAFYYYAAGEIKQGDEAAKQAVDGRRSVGSRADREEPRQHPQAGDQAAGAIEEQAASRAARRPASSSSRTRSAASAAAAPTPVTPTP